jgi:hypothetical protein
MRTSPIKPGRNGALDVEDVQNDGNDMEEWRSLKDGEDGLGKAEERKKRALISPTLTWAMHGLQIFGHRWWQKCLKVYVYCMLSGKVLSAQKCTWGANIWRRHA